MLLWFLFLCIFRVAHALVSTREIIVHLVIGFDKIIKWLCIHSIRCSHFWLEYLNVMGMLSTIVSIGIDINLSNLCYCIIDISIILLITIFMSLHAVRLCLAMSLFKAIGESILAIVCHLELSSHQTIALCMTNLEHVVHCAVVC